MDRTTLRLSSGLLAGGFIVYVVAGLLHTGGPANNHRVVFVDYANSGDWTAVHVGQFVGMALIIAGLLVLYSALELRAVGATWVARLGAVSAAVALGLYGVLQAVDGVALKQAVDAWVSAPDAQKGARFASAETVRWLEWGTRSYQSYMLGLALVLLGCAVALASRLPSVLGYVMALSGAAYLVQGWVLGSQGFSGTDTFAILGGYVLIVAWIAWLLAIAWRPTPRGPAAATEQSLRASAR